MKEEINPYQPPLTDPTAYLPPGQSQLHRSGNVLIIPRGSEKDMPTTLCIKCGEPSVKIVRKTFAWYSPWVYLALLVNIIVFAILAAVIGKKMSIPCGLCKRHARGRFTGILLCTLGLLGGIGALIGGIATEEPMIGGAGMVLLLAAIIVGITLTSLLRPVRIDELRGQFKGLGDLFLSQFPTQTL